MASAFAANVNWEVTNNIMGENSNHFITFTSESGTSQTVTFSGTAKVTGTHQLQLSAREPGAEYPMDTVTVVIRATDSNAPVIIADEAEGSVLTAIIENPLVQASMAVLILFVLMGALMLRGRVKSAKENERRARRMADYRDTRGMVDLPQRTIVQQRAPPASRPRESSIFDEFRKR